jgi:hypothetical protein
MLMDLDVETQGINENKRCDDLEIQGDSSVANKISMSGDTVTIVQQCNNVESKFKMKSF